SARKLAGAARPALWSAAHVHILGKSRRRNGVGLGTAQSTQPVDVCGSFVCLTRRLLTLFPDWLADVAASGARVPLWHVSTVRHDTGPQVLCAAGTYQTALCRVAAVPSYRAMNPRSATMLARHPRAGSELASVPSGSRHLRSAN